ncbi:MAG: glutathione S-transferase family protein [Gammaproteobacteria bacterium]
MQPPDSPAPAAAGAAPIELYSCGSPNVIKVLFMLGETGLAYVARPLSLMRGEQFEGRFLALNPNGKLPVIVDPDGPGGQPHAVFESGAILIYLAEKTGRLLPADPAARSTALQWLMWQMAGVGPMFGQALHFKYLAPPGNDYGRQRYLTEIDRLYDVAERRLAQVPWLGGAEFTIADVATYPWLGKYVKSLEVDIGRRPAVQRWIAAVEARPGWQRIEATAKAWFKATGSEQQQATQAQLDRFFGRLPSRAAP